MEIHSLIVIIVIVFLLYMSISAEGLDMFCPKKCHSFNKGKCGDGKSKFFIDGKPDKADSKEILLQKIEWTSDYNNKTVKWRRAFICAFICALLLIPLTLDNPSEQLTAKLFLTVVTVIWIVFYFSFSFYHYHYDKYPSQYVKDSISLLREQLNIKPPTKELVDIIDMH